MDTILKIIAWINLNKLKVMGIGVGLAGAVLGIFELIPGDQGESVLQNIISFLSGLIGG